MSGRSGMSVNNSWVSFHFEDGQGNIVTDIPQGALGYKNVVTIWNGGRSLSESIIVDVILPNSFPHANPGTAELELRHATSNSSFSKWTVNRRSIKKTASDRANVSTLGPRGTTVTIELCNARYLDPATNVYTSSAPGKNFSDNINIV